MNFDKPVARLLPSLTAALCFGTMFPVAASALHHIDAVHLTAIRYGLATLIFLGVLSAVEGRAALSPGRRGLELWALGSAGFAIFNLLAYLGLGSSTPQHASVFIALMPIMTGAGDALITRTPPRPAIAGFAIVALAGVALVISGGHPADLVRGGLRVGDALFALAAASFVVYALGARRFPDYSPLRYTSLSAAGGTVTILAVTGIVTLVGAERPPTLADLAADWWQVAYLVVVGAVIAVLAFNEGVSCWARPTRCCSAISPRSSRSASASGRATRPRPRVRRHRADGRRARGRQPRRPRPRPARQLAAGCGCFAHFAVNVRNSTISAPSSEATARAPFPGGGTRTFRP